MFPYWPSSTLCSKDQPDSRPEKKKSVYIITSCPLGLSLCTSMNSMIVRSGACNFEMGLYFYYISILHIKPLENFCVHPPGILHTTEILLKPMPDGEQLLSKSHILYQHDAEPEPLSGVFCLDQNNVNLSTLPAEASPPRSACASVNNNSSSQQLLYKSLDLLTNHNKNFNAEFRFLSLGDLHINSGKSGNQETGPCESPLSTFQMKSDLLFVSPLGNFYFKKPKRQHKIKAISGFFRSWLKHRSVLE